MTDCTIVTTAPLLLGLLEIIRTFTVLEGHPHLRIVWSRLAGFDGKGKHCGSRVIRAERSAQHPQTACVQSRKRSESGFGKDSSKLSTPALLRDPVGLVIVLYATVSNDEKMPYQLEETKVPRDDCNITRKASATTRSVTMKRRMYRYRYSDVATPRWPDLRVRDSPKMPIEELSNIQQFIPVAVSRR